MKDIAQIQEEQTLQVTHESLDNPVYQRQNLSLMGEAPTKMQQFSIENNLVGSSIVIDKDLSLEPENFSKGAPCTAAQLPLNNNDAKVQLIEQETFKIGKRSKEETKQEEEEVKQAKKKIANSVKLETIKAPMWQDRMNNFHNKKDPEMGR